MDRIQTDQLCHQDILPIIAEIQKQKLCWSSQEVNSAWCKTHHTKHEDLANQARENGNINMQAHQWSKSLSFYNHAIFLAPPESETLSLAVANRAMVWIKLEEYQKAHWDLTWLLSIGKYPQDSIYKIWQRLGTVLLQLGKFNESIDAFAQSYESLKGSQVSKNVKRKNIEELNYKIQKAKQGKNGSNAKAATEVDQKRAEHFLIKEHEELSGFSSKINVQYSEAKGRHTVANEVIEPGEIICETQSVASIIRFNETLKFCYNCLTHAASPIPCSQCSGVAFCSLDCRDQAWYRHQFDCPLSFMDINFDNEKWGIEPTSRKFLPLKTLTLKSAQFYIENCAEFDEPQMQKLPISTTGFASTDVLFNSVTHLTTTKNLLEHIFVAVFLHDCLQHTGFFNAQNSSHLEIHFKDERKNPQIFFIGLLFHFLLNTMSNNHGIGIGNFQQKRYATGIFTRAVSLLNHSCAPNTGVVCTKDIQMTVATKRIGIGEEICHIYHGNYAETPLDQRQESLKNTYHFSCSCQACLENWPMYADLEGDFINDEYEALSHEFKNAMDEKDYWRGLDLIRKRLFLVCDHLQEPHQLFVENRVAYMECLRHCYGNLFYSPSIK